MQPNDNEIVDVEIVSPWNSLEKTKIILDILKTVATLGLTATLFYLGHIYTQSSQQQANEAASKERAQAIVAAKTDRANAIVAEQYAQVVKKRVEIWDKVSPDLNDIYCYFLYVGTWKELKPQEVVRRKRRADKLMYSYRPFFTESFFNKYNALIDECFKHYNGVNIDAGLRTKPDRPQDSNHAPKQFTNEENSTAIHNAYLSLQNTAAKELNVLIDTATTKPAPRNKPFRHPTESLSTGH